MNAILLEKLKDKAAALSYVFILLILGLPLWWQTTTVYRANLPYTEIEDLTQQSNIKQKVNILLITEDAINTHKLGPHLQSIFLNSEVYDVELSVRTPSESEQKAIKSVDSLADIDATLGKELSVNRVGWIVLLEVPGLVLEGMDSVVAGNHRTVYFEKSCKAEDIAGLVMDVMLGEYTLYQEWKTWQSSGHQDRQSELARRRQEGGQLARKKTTGHIDLQLSLLVPEPDMVIAHWDIQNAVEAYIKPFLEKFPLQVSVNSQVLYLTDFKLKQTTEGGLEVTGEQIGLALNHVESLLNSQSSVNPAINLIIYIPRITQSPLTIKDSPSGSFVVPRWGGVLVYNYFDSNDPQFHGAKFPTKLTLDMEKIAGVWLGQLRTLLGVANVEDTRALPLNADGVRLWEIDYQHRYRSLENYLETASTLYSLSSLLGQISNIVIVEDIARRVENALSALKSSVENLETGNLVEGHSGSQEAIQQAEAAFFDPSLLALLYFPDDQKYAIYVPYFVPVGLPILLSIKSIVKLMKSNEKLD
eukprot:TRINITY_DN4783_c0_g1_i4.p1 TRINITY_DN4783_c0_g1~~TRINITY_DN4783_c0_g1_i4.p1  ORF type:complete len:531 (-),score=115.00 TRINITY_DN4783_c0_g1_i4:192-1784(-)